MCFSDAGVDRRAEAAPMVRRVYHIYGVNCNTEVGAAFKFRSFHLKEGKINPRIVVDTKARISAARKNGYTVTNGIIMETKDTEQVGLDLGFPRV